MTPRKCSVTWKTHYMREVGVETNMINYKKLSELGFNTMHAQY